MVSPRLNELTHNIPYIYNVYVLKWYEIFSLTTIVYLQKYNSVELTSCWNLLATSYINATHLGNFCSKSFIRNDVRLYHLTIFLDSWTWYIPQMLTERISSGSLRRCVNSLTPGQHGRHFADDIFNYSFTNEKFCILIPISLKFVQLIKSHHWFR